MASLLKDTWPIDCQSDIPRPPGAEFTHMRIVSLLHCSMDVPLCSHSDTSISRSPFIVIPEVNSNKDPWDTGLKAAAGLQIPSL